MTELAEDDHQPVNGDGDYLDNCVHSGGHYRATATGYRLFNNLFLILWYVMYVVTALTKGLLCCLEEKKL